jgi:hypothetical protein
VSAPFETTPPPACPLCASVLDPSSVRCPSCGLYLPASAGKPNPFSSAALWAMLGGLGLVYAITLAVVALSH